MGWHVRGPRLWRRPLRGRRFAGVRLCFVACLAIAAGCCRPSAPGNHRRLTEDGAPRKATDPYEVSPLFDAIDSNDAQMVRELLDAGADIDVRHPCYVHYGTPLVYALLTERRQIALMLVSRGAAMGVPGCKYSPLGLAGARDDCALLGTLLARDVSADALGEALCAAGRAGAVRAMRLLIKRGAQVDAGGEAGKPTPLFWAAAGGSDEAVKMLLEHGADIAYECDSGSPLHYAAQGGRAAVVSVLLKSGANPLSRDWRGDTSLHHAAERCAVEVARLLLAAGCPSCAKNGSGETPLHVVGTVPGHDETNAVDTARTLLETGAETESRDCTGATPLLRACDNGHGLVLKLLVEKGADCTVRDREGISALHYAAARMPPEAVELLLERGLPVDVLDDDLNTPLHWAAAADRWETVQSLLARGADPRAAAKNGYTPLHCLCKEGSVRTALLLLNHGADINAVASSATPLDIARHWRNTQLVALLEDWPSRRR